MIKITDSTRAKTKNFAQLSIGDFFRYQGNYYIKIKDADLESGAQALNLSKKGVIGYFRYDDRATPVDAEITIYPEETL
ncbi:MAG: hypothetical protein LUF92_17205 [Clostridiales bacterium]|nr:hypothetical protein [Clostridiales bacterium]